MAWIKPSKKDMAVNFSYSKGDLPARFVAEGRWRPSSRSVSGVGPSGSVSGSSAVNASPPPCAAMSGGSALCIAGRSAPRQVPLLILALVSVAGAPAFLPRPSWAPRAAVGSAVQVVRLHRSSVALPLGRGLPPRAVAQVGFPGPWAVGRPPARQRVPGPGWGPGRGPGNREMTALPAAPSARLVERGAAGAPVRRVSGPVGPPRRTLPEPGGLPPP